MVGKYQVIILISILILGFSLNFYAANTAPITWDEKHDFPGVRQISFNRNNFHLPLVDRYGNGNIAFKYLIRLGWDIFGETLLGARIPSVIIGTLTILAVYLLTKIALSVEVALFASFLLAISQYHIGICRSANYSSPHLLFVTISLLLFYKSILNSNKKLLMINGLIIGIGFWVKEGMIFLIPIYFLFLLTSSQFREWLKNKYFWLSLSVSFCIIFLIAFMSLKLHVHRIDYARSVISFGPSINALGFYLGELILLMIRPFPGFFRYVVNSMDGELPLVNFIFGIVILLAVIKSMRDKNPFIRLLLVCFLFNFAVLCFMRKGDDINSFWSIGALNWSCLGFIPGVVLAANMLWNFTIRYKNLGKILLTFLIVFMLMRTMDFVSYPLNCYFPAKDFFLERSLGFAEYGLEDGDVGFAKDLFKRIYNNTDNKPEYKRQAALKLAEIFIEKRDYKQSRKYLYYILSNDFNDSKGLELLKKLKNLQDLEK